MIKPPAAGVSGDPVTAVIPLMNLTSARGWSINWETGFHSIGQSWMTEPNLAVGEISAAARRSIGEGKIKGMEQADLIKDCMRARGFTVMMGRPLMS